MIKVRNMHLGAFVSENEVAHNRKWLSSLKPENLVIQIDKEIAIMSANGRPYTPFIIALLSSNKIVPVVSTTEKLPANNFMLPVIIDKTAGPNGLKIMLDVTGIAKPNPLGEGYIIKSGSSLEMFGLLLAASVCYQMVYGLEHSNRYLNDNLATTLSKAYTAMTLPTMITLGRVDTHVRDMVELALTSQAFKLMGYSGSASDAKALHQMRAAQSTITEDDLKFMHATLEEDSLARDTFQEFYDDVIVKLFPVYRHIRVEQFYAKFTDRYGVRSLNSCRYMPYLAALLMSTKEGYSLYGGYTKGVVEESGKMFYVTMLRTNDRVVANIIRDSKQIK